MWAVIRDRHGDLRALDLRQDGSKDHVAAAHTKELMEAVFATHGMDYEVTRDASSRSARFVFPVVWHRRGMMLRHLRQNAVAYLALAVALSTGSAYAAERIANGSVTTKKLANNAVTSTKLKNNAVRSIDIKSGTVNADDIGTDAVTSTEIANNSVTTTDVQDGTLLGADIRDNTLTRADINDNVVPQDADIIFSNVGATDPPAVAQGPGLNSFQFTLPRNSKLAIEFFAGELGVDCAGGAQGQVGVYLDGQPRNFTLTNVPASADAGPVQIITQDFLQAGTHTLTTGEQCVGGVAYGPTVPAKRVTWTVHMLSR